jgi:hypothetical protein
MLRVPSLSDHVNEERVAPGGLILDRSPQGVVSRDWLGECSDSVHSHDGSGQDPGKVLLELSVDVVDEDLFDSRRLEAARVGVGQSASSLLTVGFGDSSPSGSLQGVSGEGARLPQVLGIVVFVASNHQGL